ncbi:MAG: Na+/H+ antiporter NhaC family protein [Pseudomonadota bacterium]
METSALSLLPPLLAIGLALLTRHIYLSLGGGLWLGYTLLGGFNPFVGAAAMIEGCIAVFGEPGSTRVLVFTLVMGSLIATLERSGGVQGFVTWIQGRRWVRSGKGAQWLSWLLGIGIFIESNITVLVAGTVSRPLYDRYRVAREKLAYIIDSTSAPICILIPLNAWGAFNLGLLGAVDGVDPLPTFLEAIAWNFYALAAVLLAAATIAFEWNLGPMARAEKRTRAGERLWPEATPMIDPSLLDHKDTSAVEPRARNMLVPLLALLAAMPVGLYITGGGDLMQGSGSTSILWAALLANAVAWCLLLTQGEMSLALLTETFLRGAGGLLPLAMILLLSLAMGDLTGELGTGPFVSGLLSDVLSPALLLPAIFLCAALMAFAIGSSWGTFAIMIPIALPLAITQGLPPAPFLAAVLSGGIFGDHASPISDTTVISSMAAATDHIDHVRTQLPYALIGGAIAITGFSIGGLLLV